MVKGRKAPGIAKLTIGLAHKPNTTWILVAVKKQKKNYIKSEYSNAVNKIKRLEC